MKFIFVSLCLVAVSHECFAKRCTEDDMLKCVSNVVAVMQKVSSTGRYGDFTIECPNIEQSIHCLKDCEAEFPAVSKLISVIDFYFSEYCGENGKAYKDTTPCFEANGLLFEQCSRDVSLPNEIMCNLVDSMLCIARFTKEKCENGKAYGIALEKRMMKRMDTCSGAGHLANSFLAFATTVLSALLIRNKLQ